MEQFNLEKYLENPSRKVVTRDGKSVRIICTDRRDLNFPIVALIEKDSGGEVIYAHTKNGIYCNTCPTTYDLFFAPEKHEGYVSIYRGVKNDDYFTVGIFDSEEKAKERGGSIATVKVEWED